MRLIWDARSEQMYHVGQDEGITSGSVVMIREITRRLAERGHTVHVVTNDLEMEEQRAPTLWYWGPKNFPQDADVVVLTHQVDPELPYAAKALVVAHTGCTPELGPSGEWAASVDAWPVFSEKHRDLLLQHNPLIPRERTFLTGLGVDTEDYDGVEWDKNGKPIEKVPGRLLYGNDPMRGLRETLDVFDLVKREIPDATLHVAYGFDEQLARVKWEHSYRAEYLLECDRRMDSTEGVLKLQALRREDLVREQLECQVHCMPSNPDGIGTQTHGLFQLECAAAGAALVLSDVEAFPEVFGAGAQILPPIGKYEPEAERRCDAADYAYYVVQLMKDRYLWQEASRKARALAETMTWEKVADEWQAMLEILTAEKEEANA